MVTTAVKPVRILIVDDHLVMRAGLRMVIESRPGLQVIGMASNRAEALQLAAKESPDLILLDLDLGGESALSFLPELRAQAKEGRVLVLTGVRDVDEHRKAVRLGAQGVVMKENATEVLVKAIAKVTEGEYWLDRSTVGTLLTEMTRKDEDDPEAAKISSLTARENQVIALIAEGLKNKQIAERLFISETTVTHHLSSIFSKLDVSDRLELVIYAFGHNLARMPRTPSQK